MDSNMENRWKTTDLYIAAFCLCKDMQIAGTERYEGKVTFVFDDTPAREQLISDYVNNAALVPPRQYKEALQALKDLIYGD